MRTVTLCISAVILAAFLSSVPARAQVLSGSIVGEVADVTGAVVPDATVRITQRETNQVRSTITNAGGEFSFPSLQGGTYDVVVSKQGFQTFTAQAVSVAVGQVARIDAALRIGAVSETVLVTAEAAALQTDRAEVRT